MGAIDLTDDGNIYFPSNDGKHWISEKQRRVNEILQDYDPKLQLQWIPPGRRNDEDHPFRVVCFPENGNPYLVCTALEADERLLATIFRADAKRRGKNLLSYLDDYNAAKAIYNAKINHENRQEEREIAAAAVRNDKSHFRVYNHRGELIDLERGGRSDSRTTYIWR